ncbi:hypothetical protein GCM10027036_18210 [Flavihumibacter cheonanensis]|uniref:hypothetical protein n=1 Tax=Flavihumibacter cheonanensis TaxID=1442385 RepID=UPI001EF77C03|nr:hypothetical protein [Flavihumibacter cheonanensis]MCG7750739.1 hypothetical protein [Flavihumibacter cheonanensis]
MGFNKKISSFFLLAFLLLQIHSLIPHHHHKERTSEHTHHGSGAHTHHHDEEPASDLPHDADLGKIVTRQEESGLSAYTILVEFDLPEQFTFQLKAREFNQDTLFSGNKAFEPDPGFPPGNSLRGPPSA